MYTKISSYLKSHSMHKLNRRFCSNSSTLNKTFFNSDSRKALTNTLLTDIEFLCHQKRLNDAVNLLHSSDHNQPSASIYSKLLHLCVQQRSLEQGQRVHEHTKISKFQPGVFVSNRILEMYAKCGSLVDAQKVFDEMKDKDVCSWNVLISGYAKSGRVDEARTLFDQMLERDNFSWTAMISGYVRHDRPREALDMYRTMQRNDRLRCNKFSISSALAASAGIPSLNLGKEIHGHMLRTGLDSDEVVWSALSDMYGKCGSIDEARHIFDKTSNKDVVSWTAMIDRYFADGRREDGFQLFRDLMRSGIIPNEYTFAGVLKACTDGAENIGKEVHGYMTRIGFDPVSYATSALVNMYSKCGNMENAKRVFDEINQPDLVSWTSLVTGYAQNGEHVEALRYFDLLLKSGARPDHVTFVGVLSACTHAGLVDKGLEYFYSIKDRYGLKQTADHYACIVDLLARSGRFQEAENIIDKMQIKPDKFLWASLLGGCRTHGNIKLATRAAEALLEIEPDNPATYITYANIFATTGMWNEVAKVRKMMYERGITKEPGKSWIAVKRQVHTFLVGDTSHPKSIEIHEFLKDICRRMREEGYNPDTSVVLHDVEEEQKEQNLTYHSERLAVAFGILATPPGTAIKIFKNLRTCVDCHTAIKYISKIAERKIVVRDSNRFHCFKDGSCSCSDYW